MNDPSDHQYNTPTQPNHHTSIRDASGDVPVVSQTQHQHLSSDNTTTTNNDIHIYSTVYEHDDSGYQSPIIDDLDASNRLVIDTLIPSPDLARVNVLSFTNNIENATQSKRKVQDDGRRKSTTKRKVVYRLKRTGLFHILRKPLLEDDATVDTKSIRSIALNNFAKNERAFRSNISKPSMDVLPSALVNQLEQSLPINIHGNYHRILMEGFMKSKLNDSYLLLVSTSHPYLRNLALWKNRISNVLSQYPYQPVIFGTSIYVLLKIRVTNNPFLKKIDHPFLENELFEHISEKGGYGCYITFEDNSSPTMLLKFSQFLEYPKDIMIFKEGYMHSTSPIFDIMKKILTRENLTKVTARYLDELYGDPYSTQTITYHHDHCLDLVLKHNTLKKQKKEPISSDKLIDAISIDPSDSALCEYIAFVDDQMFSAIKNIYGQFSEFTTPIFTQQLMSNLADEFKAKLRRQYDVIITQLHKHKLSLKDHPSQEEETSIKINDRTALYQFFSNMRKRNNHLFPWWALVNTAATFELKTHIQMTSYFGIALNDKSMKSKLQAKFPNRLVQVDIKTTLQNETYGIGIFDNSQLIRQMKFQRKAMSALSCLVTSRIWLKPIIFDNITKAVIDNVSLIPITDYIDIKLPSAPNMASYESFEIHSKKTYDIKSYDINSGVTTSAVDLTGSRVNAYAKIIAVAGMVYRLKRLIPPGRLEAFSFQRSIIKNIFTEEGIINRLDCNRYNFAGESKSFYSRMNRFQVELVHQWRGITPKASMMILPVSSSDETSNQGAATVLLSMLSYFGIIEIDSTSSETGEETLKNISLVDGYESRYVMIVGDGLTQIRMNTFQEVIKNASYRYGKRHEIATTLSKAMKQVINLPGDLHGGCFHFLSAIYSMFYAPLIQPIQTLLGWKRIVGSDVTKCYQQASGLVYMISDEIERHLIGEFLLNVYSTEVKKRDYDSIRDPEEFAIRIAHDYLEWVEHKRETTTDECFVLLLNFVTLTSMYRSFRASLRAGDSVMIEYLYNQFLPIFLLTGKKHYYNLGLNMIDAYYGEDATYSNLHFVRINRTVPLYDGVDKRGEYMSHWPLDGIIELIQKFYDKLKFQNDIKGWLKNSGHAMLINKSKRFVLLEYIRNLTGRSRDLKTMDNLDNSPHLDRNNCMKTTIIPSREKEKKAIYEYLSLLTYNVEKPGRQYNLNTCWSILESVTTMIDEENDEERSNRIIRELDDEEHEFFDAVTESIFNDNSNDEWDLIGMDPEEVAAGDDNSDNESDEEGDEENNNCINEKHIAKVTIGNRRITNIRVGSVCQSAFKDVMQQGRKKMEKENLFITRKRKKERQMRDLETKKEIYEELRNMNDEGQSQSEMYEYINKFRAFKL